MKRKRGGLRIMIVPEEGGESRSIRLSPAGTRWALLGGIALVVAVGLMAMSWWFLALEAAKGWRQEALLDSLQAERGQIVALVEQLDELEAEYLHLRSLFGPTADPVAPDLWLPPLPLPPTSNS